MMDGCARTPRGAGQSQPGQDWGVKTHLSPWAAFPIPILGVEPVSQALCSRPH